MSFLPAGEVHQFLSVYLNIRANPEKQRKPPSTNSIRIFARIPPATRFRKSTALRMEVTVFRQRSGSYHHAQGTKPERTTPDRASLSRPHTQPTRSGVGRSAIRR